MNTPRAFKGKVVLIQGAGRTPGPALARAFAAQGANVAACDLSPVLLNPLELDGQGLPGEIRAYVGDTSRGMPARAILDEVDGDFGPIDILVNNPRVAPDTPLLQADEWDWQRTIEANLNGSFLLTHLTGRAMSAQGGGVVINLFAAPAPGLAVKGRAAYAASQMGLLGLTRAAALEFMAYNIRVYGLSVEPLFDNTGSTVANAPCRWIGEATPDEPALQALYSIEELVLFLSSTSAAHIPGQVFQAQTVLAQE